MKIQDLEVGARLSRRYTKLATTRASILAAINEPNSWNRVAMLFGCEKDDDPILSAERNDQLRNFYLVCLIDELTDLGNQLRAIGVDVPPLDEPIVNVTYLMGVLPQVTAADRSPLPSADASL